MSSMVCGDNVRPPLNYQVTVCAKEPGRATSAWALPRSRRAPLAVRQSPNRNFPQQTKITQRGQNNPARMKSSSADKQPGASVPKCRTRRFLIGSFAKKLGSFAKRTLIFKEPTCERAKKVLIFQGTYSTLSPRLDTKCIATVTRDRRR